MFNETTAEKPLLLRTLQFPLTRLLILGGIIFFLMGWTQGQLELAKDNPVLALAIALGMSAVALAIFTAWGRIIER
eukprot:gene4860-6617_t